MMLVIIDKREYDYPCAFYQSYGLLLNKTFKIEIMENKIFVLKKIINSPLLSPMTRKK